MELTRLNDARQAELPQETSAEVPRQVRVGNGRCQVPSIAPLRGSLQRRRCIESQVDADRKSDWIAMLGHELRNPVGAIGMGLELVKSRAPEVEWLAPTFEMMQRQIKQIVVLLDDLLDAAHVTTGKLEIRREPVDLAKVASDALDTVQRLFEQRRHELSVVLPARGSVWVLGDHIRLVQAVVNVLANAAKYTPRGGHVAVEVTAESETALVTVRDSGIGIAREFMPYLFELFSQGECALEGNERGMGLGLPLARNLARLHGGDIWASSEGAGEGSQFQIRLPARPYEPLASVPTLGREGKATQSEATRRVLVVEDDPDQLESLQQLLSTYGHEARAASDGPAAIAIARAFEPDAALIDLGLPGMDGYELANVLRERFPYALLIAVTGYQKDFGSWGSDDFDHHVIKPIDTRRLSALLSESG